MSVFPTFHNINTFSTIISKIHCPYVDHKFDLVQHQFEVLALDLRSIFLRSNGIHTTLVLCFKPFSFLSFSSFMIILGNSDGYHLF